MITIKRVDNSYPRYIEHLLYLTQVALFSLDIKSQSDASTSAELASYIVWGTLGGLYILAAIFENLRLIQIPQFVSFVAYSIVAIIDVVKMNFHKNRFLALILLGVGLMISIYLRMVFGNVNFSKYPEYDAPYKAGYQTIRT
jgi:hypothetical protein